MPCKPGPKPKPKEAETELPVLSTKPAIKVGRRPVTIKPGFVVYALVSEPEESVRARYLEKLNSRKYA